MTSNVDAATVGDLVQFRSVIGNNGPDTAHNVVVTDTLPAYLAIYNATTSRGLIAVASNTLTLTLDDVKEGDEVQLEIIALVQAAQLYPDNVNRIFVSTTTHDKDGSNNNAAVALTTVDPPMAPSSPAMAPVAQPLEAAPLTDMPGANASVTFPETGHSLSGDFLNYWNEQGSLPVFGFPIASAQQDNGQISQWLERARFELHPENAAPYNVLLGRLGVSALEGAGVDWQSLPKADSGALNFFPATGHAIANAAFWEYWSSHGLEFDGRAGKSEAESLALFGYPVSEPRIETNANGDTVVTQWFERARFEYHPDSATPSHVLLGLLGNEHLGQPR